MGWSLLLSLLWSREIGLFFGWAWLRVVVCGWESSAFLWSNPYCMFLFQTLNDILQCRFNIDLQKSAQANLFPLVENVSEPAPTVHVPLSRATWSSARFVFLFSPSPI